MTNDQITTLADRLLEAVQSLDLRKLNSNLHRIQTQMKSLEQGLEAGSGLDAMLLRKSLASLHQNSGNLRGYADTMKMLAKEVFKLNLLLKQGLSPGREKSRKSTPNLKGQHAADEGSFETRATVSPGNPVDSAGATLRTEGTTLHLMPEGREETSLIHSTTPAHEGKY
ncbi:olfactomedin-like protein 2A [Ambystoma mexicanum]|uniref:olfactomedin-like protein 2A n=1 Tax=Ambystoma mexicanum TaxID=8296 RepID=UPI0037E975E8